MVAMKKTYSLIVFLVFVNFILSSCSNSNNSVTVFVTSASGTGNLSQWPDALAVSATGVAAGDAVCQARATAAGLSGTFVAWLSDSTTDAYCHVQGHTGTVALNCGQSSLPVAAGPWVRTDGYPFANTIDKLVKNGQVYTPVRYDETGTLVTNFLYFTGTASSGAATANTCSGWTDNTNSSNTTFGSSDGTTYFWTSYSYTGCSVMDHLLCFQTGTGGSLPSLTIPASAKKVFVTSITGIGNLSSWTDAGGNTGIDAGDAICQARAIAAGITNATSFKAWLSDSTNSAIDHVTAGATTDGPFYRLDGVKIADNKAALINATSLFTAITRDETGAYNNNPVWTGTSPSGVLTTNQNCVDWTSNLSGDNGTSGIEIESNSGWTTWSSVACNGKAALYCFEDD
jgi:hypothetical protein